MTLSRDEVVGVTWADLPDDMLSCILQFLPMSDVITCCLVSHLMHRLAKDEWKQRIAREEATEFIQRRFDSLRGDKSRWCMIKTIGEPLSPADQMHFLQMVGAERMRALVSARGLLFMFKFVLAADNWVPLLNFLGSQHLQTIRTANTLSLASVIKTDYLVLLRQVLPSARRAFIELLGQDCLFSAFQQGLPLRWLGSTIPASSDALIYALEKLDIADRPWFIAFVGAEKLKQQVCGRRDLYRMLRLIPQEHRWAVLQYWSVQNIYELLLRRTEQEPNFGRILSCLPAREQQAFLSWLGPDKVREFLPNFNLLESCLSLLVNDESKVALLQKIGADQLLKMLDVPKLVLILRQLCRDSQSDFLSLFKDEQLHHLLIGDSFSFTWALHKLDQYKQEECYAALLSAATKAYCARQQQKVVKMASNDPALVAKRAHCDAKQRIADNLDLLLWQRGDKKDFGAQYQQELKQSSSLAAIY